MDTSSTRVNRMAAGLLQSEILRIAAEVRALVAQGREVCNLTVGDFRPSEFPVPAVMADAVVAALRAGETNYPPSDGLPQLRDAIRTYYQRRQGLSLSNDQVLVAGGARPVIYAAYRVLCEAGDRVVYPTPSWNNPHYCHITGAEGVAVETSAEHGFLPTRAQLEPVLRDARLLVLNSPCNPTGTMFSPDALADICDAILAENARRGAAGRPLFLLWDQVYWTLTFGDVPHASPVSLRPMMGEFTITVDAISKSLAATGLRVGWSVAPADVTRAMSDLVGHVGAWAPRPEQAAAAKVLVDDDALDAHLRTMTAALERRLRILHDGIAAMAARGAPITALRPQGAMYLSVGLPLHGRRTADGMTLESDDAIRAWLLDRAGIAVVPFHAFGSAPNTGWFRFSVGAVSVEELSSALPRLEAALPQERAP